MVLNINELIKIYSKIDASPEITYDTALATEVVLHRRLFTVVSCKSGKQRVQNILKFGKKSELMIVLFRNINYFSIFENSWKPNNNSLPSHLALILFVMIVIIFLGFVKTISKTSGTTKTDTSNSVIKKAKQTCYGWCFWFWNKSTRCREVTCQERQHRSLRCLVF